MKFYLAIQLTLEAQIDCGPTMKDFRTKLAEDEKVKAKIANLRQEVENFALSFPMPGFDDH